MPGPAWWGSDDGPTAVAAIQIKLHHITGCPHVKWGSGGVVAPAVVAKLIAPIAGLAEFSLVWPGIGKGVIEQVIVATEIGHGRGWFIVIPALPGADDGEAGGQVVPGVDDILGGHERQPGVAAVVVRIEGEFDGLAGHSGQHKGIGGRISIAPIATFHCFPLVTPGIGDGVVAAVNTVAANQVAVRAVIIKRGAAVVPALETAGQAPVAAAAAVGGDGGTAVA